ncbi:TonB-dependent receptor [Hyphomonas adhaerens MHS-3]|uniref:TonB-dependent receptor n=2 Tax=Hyphomonas adhaerens TaxID=81029 RepID=A0A069E7G8_9PROT|nr:TonB-dependent receptor [Hyphomonas adhaerens MHS-3]
MLNGVTRNESACRSRMKTRILVTSALFSIASPIASQAFAQQADEAVATNAPDTSRQLDTVTVTARRVEENLQNAPVAVTAFNANDLELRAAEQLDDVARFSPNVAAYPGAFSVSDSGQLFIRGIGQFDYIVTTDPGVGVYLDGVYLARTTGNLLDLADVERIEVLRGPQGTLYGKNALGGAVNVVTRKPSNDARGKAAVTVGEYNRIDAYGFLSGPLVKDKLAGSIAVMTQNRDGYVERVLEPGKTQGGTDSQAARVALRWTPTESFSFDLAGDYTSSDTEQGPYRYAGRFTDDPAVLYTLLDPGGVDQYDTDNLLESYATGDNYVEVDIWGISGTAEWELGNSTLSSISSFRSSEIANLGDLDGTPFSILTEYDDISQEQFSQELRLSGTSMDGKLNYTSGLFYLTEDADQYINVDILSDLPVLPAPGILDRIVSANQKQESYAAYGQADYTLNEKWSVTGGLRYTYEEKKATLSTFRDTLGFYELAPGTYTESWDALTPRIGLNYQYSDSVLFYGSVAQGFKSGGFNGRATSLDTVGPFDPENVWTYELGLKSELFSRRLRFNAAAFMNDYEDLQFSVSSLADDGVTLLIGLENAAAAEINGFEMEVVAVPADNLDVSFSLGYLDAKFTEVSPQADEITADSKLMGAPEWTTSLAAQYRIPVHGLGEFTLAGDYSYRSKIYFNPLNTEGITGALELVNAQVSFAPENSNIQFTAGVTNLFDEEYYASGLGPAGLGMIRGVVGRPQEWFARATYSF